MGLTKMSTPKRDKYFYYGDTELRMNAQPKLRDWARDSHAWVFNDVATSLLFRRQELFGTTINEFADCSL